MKKRLSRCFLCFLCIAALIISSTGCSSTVETGEPNQTEENTGIQQPGETGNEEEINNNEEDKQTYKLVLKSEKDRQPVKVSFEPVKYEASVEPYKVNTDLSNIENLEQYGDFTEKQKQFLIRNGFIVNPAKQEQLFYIYEENEYKKIPSFVTTDSVLQVYHIFYDYSLRVLENEKLIGMLEKLTSSMLQKSVYLYNRIDDEEIRSVQLKNIAFFATAQLALEKPLPENIPQEAKDQALEEYQLICDMNGFNESVIFPYELDYSQYRSRGHYTRNDDFKRYFKAMMWYGQAPFPLYKDEETKERNVEQTLQALLITYSLFLENSGTPDSVLWENIYDPTVFYVGNTDDLNIYHYKDLLVKVYGEQPDLNGLNDGEKLDRLYEEADKLPEPRIKGKYTSVTTPVGKQFRFMGQRYIPDSEIIQEMVEPILRPIPSGLDVMAVLGSDRAYDILINRYHEDEKWEDYPDALNKMADKFAEITKDVWRSNMYYGWLWVLTDFLEPLGDGYPSFMTGDAWQDKSLSTALGSWAELRHDTILYGKQSGAECGGGLEPPQVKGYVEPSIGVYEKLLWLTKYSRTNLMEREILPGSLESKIQRFEDLLQFLINCSVKELKNEELTQDEYNQLLTYGGLLEYLTSSFAGDGMRWFEITSDTDKNMAVIADIHTIAPNKMSPGGYFEVGVGPAYEIYVVVPINDKLYLTRGAVFSYYEFATAGKRLTDEEWQQMFKEDKQPLQPDWMETFIKGGKDEVPTPTEPYHSGC